MSMLLRHGPGSLAHPDAKPEVWGGRKAQQYVALTLRTYGTRCWLCGWKGADSADHVIPRSKGGAVYDLDNLAPSHKSCNYARGNRDPRIRAVPIENGMKYFT